MRFSLVDPTPYVETLLNRCKLNDRQRQLLKYLLETSYPENLWEKRTSKALGLFLDISDKAATTEVERMKEKIDAYQELLATKVIIHLGGKELIGEKLNYLLEVDSATAAEHSALHYFWRAHYFDPLLPVLIISNSPLFFRHADDSHRIRVMEVNSERDLEAYIEAGNERPELMGYRPSFHYVSSGDFRICIVLTRYFASMNKTSEVRLAVLDRNLVDLSNPTDRVEIEPKQSLIALGNPRVSVVVKHLLAKIKPNFFIDGKSTKGIINRAKRNGEEGEYVDDYSENGYFFIAVIRNASASRCDTLILVQNGPALEKLAEVMATETELERVIREAKLTKERLPDHFEILLKVEIGCSELPQRSANIQVIASRP